MAAAGSSSGEVTRPFPWGLVIHSGLSLLRLPPQTFWALTPVEFFAMTGGMGVRTAGIGRVAMERLMRVFPDG